MFKINIQIKFIYHFLSYPSELSVPVIMAPSRKRKQAAASPVKPAKKRTKAAPKGPKTTQKRRKAAENGSESDAEGELDNEPEGIEEGSDDVK